MASRHTLYYKRPGHTPVSGNSPLFTNVLIPLRFLGQIAEAPLVTPDSVKAMASTAVTGGYSRASLIVIGLLALMVGGVIGYIIQDIIRRLKKQNGTAVWPRDWPKPMFSKDDTQAGYLDLPYEAAMNAKAQPFGRTYPRLRLFPNIYPFRGLRRRVEYATSRPVYIPYKKRFQHVAILGGTGKGKSTSFVIPAMAYGAMEPDTAYFAIDVKSPQFLRNFGPLYQQAQKPVYFIDPWTPKETMAFEPVWRATGEKKKIIAEVISSYSLEPSPPSESGNSEFFKLAANRLIRALLDVAQFWPRRYAKLPCLAQLVGAGGKAIKESIENLNTLLPDFATELKPALELIYQTPSADLRPIGRRQEITEALEILDRSGYEIATRLRQYRRVRHGHPKSKNTPPKTGLALEKATAAFWIDIDRLWKERQEQLKRIVKACGEFIQMPDDTSNSVVSTVQNKIEWFTDREIARVFSRDEMDPDFLTQRPCLMLIGAPMSKLQIGSLFVSAIITNLAINSVFQRGQHIENKELGVKVSKHGVFFMLDEFPQLNVKDAHKTLATMRSFLAGLCMIYQDRGQLEQIYGKNVTTVEANTIHRIILQGVHEEAAEFYATKSMGKVKIRKENISKTDGESKRNVSIQEEMVDLMTANDVIYMKLNGKTRPDMALNMNKDFDPFPMKPIPFYEDPVCQKLLKMERRLVKKDLAGKPTWQFWQWQELWDFPKSEAKPLLIRRYPLEDDAKEGGQIDEVGARLADPYTEYLDFLAPELRTGFDELQIPDLDFSYIAVMENNPDPTTRAAAPTASPGFNPFQAAGGMPSPMAGMPPLTPVQIVPMYSKDIRTLMNDDFQPMEGIPSQDIPGGTLEDRMEANDDEEEESAFALSGPDDEDFDDDE